MSENHNALSGKKWVVCGDSFTNGLEQNTLIPEGRYRGHRSVYPYLIANRNDMELVPFFEGGRTLAYPPEPGAFRNSLTAPDMSWNYQNIPEDADYITIYLGINDSHHAPHAASGDGEDITGKIPLGSLEDKTIHSFGGAWNIVLWWWSGTGRARISASSSPTASRLRITETRPSRPRGNTASPIWI